MVDEQQVRFQPLAHTCPLRAGIGPWDQKAEGADKWLRIDDGLLLCSFCGSMHPDEFAELLPHVDGELTRIELNDHKNKIYIDFVRGGKRLTRKLKLPHLRGQQGMFRLINEKLKLSHEKFMAKVRKQ